MEGYRVQRKRGFHQCGHLLRSPDHFPDGNFLAAMNYENELKVFDTNTEAEMTFLQMEFDRTVDENDWPHCTAMVFFTRQQGILTAHTDGICGCGERE